MHDSLKHKIKQQQRNAGKGATKNIHIASKITQSLGKYLFNWLTWAFLTTTPVC
jgi:hypothetical protein